MSYAQKDSLSLESWNPQWGREGHSLCERLKSFLSPLVYSKESASLENIRALGTKIAEEVCLILRTCPLEENEGLKLAAAQQREFPFRNHRRMSVWSQDNDLAIVDDSLAFSPWKSLVDEYFQQSSFALLLDPKETPKGVSWFQKTSQNRSLPSTPYSLDPSYNAPFLFDNQDHLNYLQSDGAEVERLRSRIVKRLHIMQAGVKLLHRGRAENL